MDTFPDAPHFGGGAKAPHVRATMGRLFKLPPERADDPKVLGPTVAAILAALRATPMPPPAAATKSVDAPAAPTGTVGPFSFLRASVDAAQQAISMAAGLTILPAAAKTDGLKSEPESPSAVAQWTCRLHGMAAGGRHDAFLSYRWATDGPRTEACPAASGAVPALHAALQAAGLTAFWDQECLNLGEPLVAGFTVGLAGSKLAVLVVSQGSLDRIRAEAESRTDNVLLGACHARATLRAGATLCLDARRK